MQTAGFDVHEHDWDLYLWHHGNGSLVMVDPCGVYLLWIH